MRPQRLYRFLPILAALLLVGALSGMTGWLVGRQVMVNWMCCELPRARNYQISLAQVLHRSHFYSQSGQDVWILEIAYPGVRDGYFVDAGSADGVVASNTRALEERGWTGVCIDPFPTNMQSRTCRMFKEVVSDVAGKHVKFRASGALGGIEDSLGRWRALAEQGPHVEFTTVTLGDILDRAHAPRFIHYVSLDIEGAEYEALRGFPFDRYTMGVLDVEHNFEEPKRAQIAALMKAHGYRFVRSWLQDDFYRYDASASAP
jgi:FkbM family methyltransferase